MDVYQLSDHASYADHKQAKCIPSNWGTNFFTPYYNFVLYILSLPRKTSSTCCSLNILPRVLYRPTECQSAWDKVSGSRQQLFRTASFLCLHGRVYVGKWSAWGLRTQD